MSFGAAEKERLLLWGESMRGVLTVNDAKKDARTRRERRIDNMLTTLVSQGLCLVVK